MKICVLAGGRTPERDVSLRGGHRMTSALAELGHDVWLVDPGEEILASFGVDGTVAVAAAAGSSGV